MATEHARVEGEDVGRFTLARLGTAALMPDNPEVAALLSQRGAIEQDLDRVKQQKAGLAENQYYDQLEEVLPGGMTCAGARRASRTAPRGGPRRRGEDPSRRASAGTGTGRRS